MKIHFKNKSQNHKSKKTDFTDEEISENKKIYFESYLKEYTDLFIKAVIEPIDKIWFRSELIGWDNMPERNNLQIPLILASNHSGMAFPWDAIVFGYKMNTKFNFGNSTIRALSSPMLSQSNLMNPFLIKNLWKKSGAIDATFLNFETMMQNPDNNLLIYPEGVPGIGKGFNKRYIIQELKTSFVRMSIKYKTDIITFSTVNAEYINPFSYSSKIINKFVKRIGIPFLPIGPILPFILLQPWLFYFAFPAKLFFVLGRRIKPYEMIDKPVSEIVQEEYILLATKIHKMMQDDLTEANEKYGKQPFKLSEFFKMFFTDFKKSIKGLPTNWALLFYEFERKYQKGERNFEIKTGFFRNILLMLKNPFTICFFIPVLGWIPIAIKGYKNNSLEILNKKKGN